MTHQPPRGDRAAVRDAAVGLLLAGLPQLGGRVYRSRVWPISPQSGPTLEELPAALVYATPEVKGRQHARSSVDKMYRATCELVVMVQTIAPDGLGPIEERLEAALEELAGVVEAILLTSPEFVGAFGAIEDVAEVRTELAITAEGTPLLGTALLTFGLEWTESWSVPLPPTCEDPTITLAPLPPLSA